MYLSPENKSAAIGNVYEAVQLFQISQFQDKEDVISIEYNGKKWEHSKPGYHAIFCNYGCCSSIAAWLNYLIHDKYPETGYLCFIRPDGTGHVMNYIVYNNSYYIIDLTPMTFDKAVTCCKETGAKKDFISSKYITGHCFKTIDLSQFVIYHSRIQKFHNFEFLYYKMPDLPYLPPITIEKMEDDRILMFSSYKLEKLNNIKSIDIQFMEGPNYTPNWSYYINSSHINELEGTYHE